MSHIRMESQALISKCEMAIHYIDELDTYYQNKIIKRNIKEKNKGLGGWLRRLLRRQYNKEKAFKKLKKNRSSEYYDAKYYFGNRRNIVNSLMKVAKESPEIFLSVKDFNLLNEIINEASIILSCSNNERIKGM